MVLPGVPNTKAGAGKLTTRHNDYALLARCLDCRDAPETTDAFRLTLRAKAGELATLLRLAYDEHLLPTLHPSLTAKNLIDELNGHDRTVLRHAHAYNLIRNERLKVQVEEFADLLNRHGIRPILMKGGVALFIDYFGDPGARYLSDLDILVPPGEFGRAITIATDAGYLPQGDAYDWRFQYRPLARPTDLAAIELHQFVGQQRTVLPVSEAFAAAEPLAGAVSNILTLSPTHRILHNVFHSEIQDRGHTFLRFQLRQLYDLTCMVRYFDGLIDWEQMAEILNRAGLTRVMKARLGMADNLLGLSVPDTIGTDAQAHLGRCRYANRHRLVRRALDFWDGPTIPFKAHHIDLLYETGTGRIPLNMVRLLHLGRLVIKHRFALPAKIAAAAKRNG